MTSLSQAKKRLEKRIGRDTRIHYIVVDASTGELTLETSWLPKGALKGQWKRLKRGGYRIRIQPAQLAGTLSLLGLTLRKELS